MHIISGLIGGVIAIGTILGAGLGTFLAQTPVETPQPAQQSPLFGASVFRYAQGGTGSTTAPVSQLLYGGATAYQSVATTTLTASSPLSLSQSVVKVGGANSVLTLDTSGAWTGTASALTANGANCSAGNFPLGVDASGASETCTDAWTEAENTAANYEQNLTAGDGLTRTVDDFDCDIASGSVFGCLSTSDWTTFNDSVDPARTLTVAGTANQITSSAGAQDLSANRTWTLSLPNLVIFPSNASSTLFSTFYGSSTNQVIGNNFTFGGVTGDSWDDFCVSITGGAGLCDGNDASGGGGGSFPFETDTNYGQLVYATTSPTLWFRGGMFASSTSHFANSTTTLATIGTAWLTNLFIGVDTIAEYISDTVGAMITGNTETDITVTYDDTDNTIDFVVDTLPNLTGTLDYDSGGTGTTTAPIGQLLYGGASAYQSVATSSATCTGASGVSCTTFTIVGAGGTTIALSSIPNTSLANSTISGISLGSNLNSLTNDTTLVGTSYNGSASISDWGIDLANANTWTGKQNLYGTASSTLFSAHWLKVGATASTTIDTAGNVALPAAGTLTIPALTSAILLTDGNGLLAEYAGASCTNQFPQSVSALGAWTCDSVVLTTDVSGDLPFSNLAQVSANSVLGNITSATADATSVATSSLFTWSTAFSTTGTIRNVVEKSFTYATTSWTGTTTIPLEQPSLAKTIDGVRCRTYTTTTGTAGGTLNIQFGKSTASTTMLNASSTNNYNAFSSNNSVTAGDSWIVDVGTPASSPRLINCTYKYTI